MYNEDFDREDIEFLEGMDVEGFESVGFEEFGELEWLSPAKYYMDGWSYHKAAKGADNMFYDIVLSPDKTEYRYTII